MRQKNNLATNLRGEAAPLLKKNQFRDRILTLVENQKLVTAGN